MDNENLIIKEKVLNLTNKSQVIVDADLRMQQFPNKTFFPDEDHNTLSIENFRHNTVVACSPYDPYSASNIFDSLTINTVIPSTVDSYNKFNEFYVQYVPLNGAILTLKFWIGSDDVDKRYQIDQLTLIDVQRPVTYHFYQLSNDYKVDFDFDTLGAAHSLDYYINQD